MQTSEDHILTTHVGSLPRSEELVALLVRQHEEAHVDEPEFERLVRAEIRSAVEGQRAAGIDVAGDGEIPRLGFSLYVKDRMTGFGGRCSRKAISDFDRFPGFAKLKFGAISSASTNATVYDMPAQQEQVVYDHDLASARAELELFEEAVSEAGANSFVETFVTAASPGIISTTLLPDESQSTYKSDEDYVFALAEEMRTEYEYVVSRGHILQLDAPDLALERLVMFVDRPLSEFLDRVELHIEAINRALVNIPPDRVRLHVCWGNGDCPHDHDVELQHLLPLLYRAKVGGLSIPFANPRHQHEWRLLAESPPPESMVVLPGVIDVTTNYIEHPEVVADRIEQVATALGDPSRVIASTDCGFSTFAGYVMVAPDVSWAKLRALSDGARLASERLGLPCAALPASSERGPRRGDGTVDEAAEVTPSSPRTSATATRPA